MTQKTIKLFLDEFYSKNPKKIDTNKTDVYHIETIRSLHILDLRDYGPETERGHKYVPIVIGYFSKFGWTVPSKDKNAKTKKKSSYNFRKSTKIN